MKVTVQHFLLDVLLDDLEWSKYHGLAFKGMVYGVPHFCYISKCSSCILPEISRWQPFFKMAVKS